MKANLILLTMAAAFAAVAGLDERVPALFTGNTMVNETVMFMGTDDAVPLMYDADEVLSVTSYDLQTVYEKGTDWTYDAATHRLHLTAGTQAKYVTEAWLYPETGTFTCNLDGKAYVSFGEGATMCTNQLCVTYRHSDAWTGPAIRDESAVFAAILDELCGFSNANILFYGDSITTGANSSGAIGREPRIPGWPMQCYSMITNFTGNPRLKYVNTAVGGKTSSWGVEEARERAAKYRPRLSVIAFGMNDGFAASSYTNNIAKIARAILEGNADAGVLFVPPMIPNPEANGFDAKGTVFPEYETALIDLAADFRAKGHPHVGAANLTSVYAAVLARKRFRDMSGNNINHCNDFSARIYRDVILGAIGVAEAAECEALWRTASGTWFDGGVAQGWPNAAVKFGGNWSGTGTAAWAEGRVALDGTTAPTFTASRQVALSNENAIVSTSVRFTAYTEPPPVPNDAVTGIVAVHEGKRASYFALVKGFAGTRVWKRLPGSVAVTDADVTVEVKVGWLNGKTCAQFRIGDFVSSRLELLAAESLGTVAFAGAGSLAALVADARSNRMGTLVLICRR